jgi:uncharacterized protein GlcG (DUF336 family)
MNTHRTAQTGAVLVEPLEQRTHLASTLPHLTVADVQGLIARAASQARPGQAVVVSDREGVLLGIFSIRNRATGLTISKAIARARTAAFFESREDAFTTRTARFIIQDHFPHPVPNTPGGPLYGVEFSSLTGTDVLRTDQMGQVPNTLPLNISGDPGGIPLFKNGEPVGGIGVAGDGNDIAVREDFRGLPAFDVDNPTNAFFNGVEESDFDEKVALTGARGFMAPEFLRADKIFLDGLRLPFIKDAPANGKANRTFAQLVTSGAGALRALPAAGKTSAAIIGSPDAPYPTASFGGISGQLKNTNPAAPNFGIISSNDSRPHRLIATDVRSIITNAVKQALITRAAIRQPIGVPVRVHIAVVDRDGDILGVFRMDDGTNFSYDVAVQKARTSAFFSDDRHAFTARAIGFISQRFFPAGISGGFTGPLFGLQNELSLTPGNLRYPLKNGITIFPGGAPLYKNGQLVGAIGVSGDGVDQDDIITDAGTKGFRPREAIRCDVLGNREVVRVLRQRVGALMANFSLSTRLINLINDRLDDGLEDVQLPYVKFPRNPEL